MQMAEPFPVLLSDPRRYVGPGVQMIPCSRRQDYYCERCAPQTFSRIMSELYLAAEKYRKIPSFKTEHIHNTVYCTIAGLPTLFIATCVGLSANEFMGLYDGSFVFGPLLFAMFVQVTIVTYSGEKQGVLTMSLNNYFLRHNEPWMNTIRDQHTGLLWRIINFYLRYNWCFVSFYLVVPLTLDTVLHYGFDSLENPLVLPMPFGSLYYGGNPKWNVRYYAVSLLNWWSIMELNCSVIGPIMSFVILSGYFLTEIRIFREKIKMLELDREEQDKIDKQVIAIVQSHNNLIVLNRDLKAVFGLPCAFSALFISLFLTLCLFTAVMSDDTVVVVAYLGAFALNFLTGILYCTFGQNLENESEEMFRILCDIPWFKCEPAVRKSLNMIIRQAKNPLIVDYHGRSKMNLSTFMQILRSSYSYFTLLQSMAK
ncbi:7tm Odorant receptor [Nesidiocoris tenuis]|uniref:Odorant receptor n=1 Tax=Nesidiocoris tenuis TaxID=355587 RepID=A0ABN7B5B8_9HEMI|nr:7tm Odorant receptor [Nesidiocoris tenuis]